MRNDFIIEVLADNNFSVLNRMINVLNRRRVRIKKLVAHENEENFRKGGATMLLHTTPEMVEKVKQQLEKLIEVESAIYYEADAVQRDALFSADTLIPKSLSKSY
jgi:acetolactate synthase small subunit